MAKENQIVIDRVAKFALAFVASAWIAVAVLLLASAVSGCVNPNTGTSTIVGEQMALPEITDSSDSIAVRVYESIKGARVWTARNSVVSVVYENAYTNSYFGIVEMRDSMKLRVKVEPCEGDEPKAEGDTMTIPATAEVEKDGLEA